MFTTSSRNKSHRESFQYRAGKSMSKKHKSFKEHAPSTKRIVTHHVALSSSQQSLPTTTKTGGSSPGSPTSSAVVTICVGPEQRLFAAHEDVLCKSPFFVDACRAQFFELAGKRVDLPNETPEVFSAVLEYLYKADYTPNISYDKKRSSWYLEGTEGDEQKDHVVHTLDGTVILKDTMIYCSAYHYRLPELQRLALKKQGLAVNVQCNVILSSARYAYANTPASDSKLRAHYLALIVRSRHTFKRSGTMQMEMLAGGTPLFFDLFVAMVNHLDDLSHGRSPRV